MPLIYTDGAGRKITALKFLIQENAIVLGFEHGGIAILDLQNSAAKPIELIEPTYKEVTTIAARPIVKSKLVKNIKQTLVIVGDKGGNVTKIRVKRNGSLDCVKKGTTHAKEEVSAITICSKIDFACGTQDGTHLFTDTMAESRILDKKQPIALLPIVGTDAFIAIYQDGSNTIFGDKSKLKKGDFPANPFQDSTSPSTIQLSDVKGTIQYSSSFHGMQNYDLVALTTDGTLLLASNTKGKKVLLHDISKMDLVSQINLKTRSQSNTLACMNKAGNVYYADLSKTTQGAGFACSIEKAPPDTSSIAVSPFKPIVYVAKGNEIHQIQIQPRAKQLSKTSSISSSSSASSSPSSAMPPSLTSPLDDPRYGDPTMLPTAPTRVGYPSAPPPSPYGEPTPGPSQYGFAGKIPGGGGGTRSEERDYGALPALPGNDNIQADSIGAEEALERTGSYDQILIEPVDPRFF